MKKKEKAIATNSKQRTKSRSSIFKKEQDVLVRANEILNLQDLQGIDLHEEFRTLSHNYERLLKDLIKITRIGDMHYMKLMNANDQIQQQKIELEDLNRELRDANAAKDKLYSIIAHDLRNPVQFLLFSSDFMNTEFDKRKLDEESVKKFFRKVFNTVQHLSDLLKNLLEWTRSQHGEIKCQMEAIDLFHISNEAINFYTENTEMKRIYLFSEIQRGTRAYADKNMIQSVIRNLLSNAIKFTGEGGVIKLSAREENDMIVVTVFDTGVGIASEKIVSLFKIGENPITAGTAKEKGSGLGLLLCKDFVEMNGGKLSITSEPGKGTSAEFSLPSMNSIALKLNKNNKRRTKSV